MSSSSTNRRTPSSKNSKNKQAHPPPAVQQQHQRRSPTPQSEEEEEDVVIIQGNLNVSLSQGTHNTTAAAAAAGAAGAAAGPGGDAKMTTPTPTTTNSKEGDDEHTVVVTPTPPPIVVVPANDDATAAAVLPDTVTVLEGPNGSKVYLVGTAHFSTQSQSDVRTTISMVRPSVIVLELCHARRNILTLDEETILREAKDLSFAKLRASGIQGLLHFVLLSMSAQLTRKLGMAPGGEFRAAVNEARNLNNCLLILGDRPFNVTITRALASLTFVQKLKLAYQFIVSSSDDITKEEIERCKERDLLEKMLSEMTGEFPTITEVFVNERDTFLAHSLLLATQPRGGGDPDASAPDSDSSSAVVVVGVVGMGHVKGISAKFGATTNEDVQAISTMPDRRRGIVGSVVRYAIFGAVAYGAYRVLLHKHTPAIIDAAKHLKLQLTSLKLK